jgi:SAM-dependent methyltransferase
VARAYFDISYRLLAGSVAGRRLLALPAAGGGPVHGYFTSEDRDVLLADLDPAPGDQLLDLGSGLGGIAIDLHRRTGADILGVDISSQAVSRATTRARQAGVGASVGFLAGDLARPPRTGAAGAYAIDSLMFVPDLAGALRGIGDTLGPGGRLFATLLVVGPGAEARLEQAIRAAGADLERLDDVTPALAERSRARAGAAALLKRDGTTTSRGRLAMRLVSAEESLVQARIASGRLNRWRFVVRYGSLLERDAAHIRATEDAA